MLAACSPVERAMDAPDAGIGVGKMAGSVVVGSLPSAQLAFVDHAVPALPSQVSATTSDVRLRSAAIAAKASTHARSLRREAIRFFGICVAPLPNAQNGSCAC